MKTAEKLDLRITMNARTYTGSTIQETLNQIKRDLGPDAVILCTQSVVKRGAFGWTKAQNWEITATMPKMVASAPRPVMKLAFEQQELPTQMNTRLQQNDSRIEELLEEVSALKRSVKLIGTVMSGRTSENSGVYAELVEQGVDPETAESLVKAVDYDNPTSAERRTRVRRALAEMLIVDTPAELKSKSRVVSVFVGPTGAGKTTTIAKIAGHAKVRFGKRVALISTDMLRVGGYEQLARYGDLLGIPTYSCNDITALGDLVKSLDDRDLILIDTPGSAAADFTRLTAMEAFTNSGEARVHLVISASTRSEDVMNIVRKFHRFAPRRVVITKIDESDPKGAFVGDILRNEMPISYLTNGQRVPEDLLTPSTDDLTKYLLPVEEQPAIQLPVEMRSL
jgi:flagellar biosynthesis protein FlhF